MSTEHLNLARKWRSRNFDQVIGQDLSVRILKNSLYLQHLFPVYLFSGQHGCGKTTTARIFAAAVNCSNLELFQQDPRKYSIPCLNCSSCCAITEGNHPDFIEIDGASHTGVDNVRHIIDIAAFLPILGRKKIYLIDEAHMLSKAAFNAFLKIMEEPPATALFILATTELHKIIETVRSRSFQLIFRSVSQEILLNHLETICQHEKIVYERDGLVKIIKKAKGSVRDALNLLEQVRFEGESVSKAATLRVFGHLDDELLLSLMKIIIQGDSEQVLQFLSKNNLAALSVETLWESVVEILNACLWACYKIAPKNFSDYSQEISNLSASSSSSYFIYCLSILYEHELLFQKTGYPWHLFELLLMRMCQAPKTGSNNVAQSSHKQLIESGNKNTVTINARTRVTAQDIVSNNAPLDNHIKTSNDPWKLFVDHLNQRDPMVGSIFKQAIFEEYDAAQKAVTIVFAPEYHFFNDIIQTSESLWNEQLQKSFSSGTQLKVLFKKKEGSASLQPKKENIHHEKEQYVKKIVSSASESFAPKRNLEIKKNNTLYKSIDVSDTQQWQKASLLKTVFEGTIKEIPEGSHE